MLEQLRDVLKSLKWQEYEIAVYAALVEKGAMQPRDLIFEADVPSGRVYHILNLLAKRGAIVQTGSRPKSFDAQNPRKVLHTELDQIEKKVDKALQSAEQAFEKRANAITNSSESAWTVNGQRGIITQIRALTEEAKKSIVISDNDISWLGRRDFRILKKMVASGIDVKVISTMNFVEDLEHMNSLGIVTMVGQTVPDIYIIDKSIVLMKLGSPPSGLVVREQNFVNKTISDFERDFKALKRVEANEVAS